MTVIEEIYRSGEPFDGHYRLIRPLSSDGGSGEVWLAVDLNTVTDPDSIDSATRVAIKIYRPKNMIDVEGHYQFRSEFKKVFSCHHANIIQPTYFSIFKEMPYLVTPFCPSGSAEKHIGKLKGEELTKYIFEVASGLAYLHERRPMIIHQDIKPANVLIDDNGNYAVTDFGISAAMGTPEEGEDDSGGTLAYMAPERFTDDTPPMAESDIWAFGASLYELVEGDVPFGEEGGGMQTHSTPVPAFKAQVPDGVKKLITACLAYDPKDRPTAQEIVDAVLKKRYSRTRKIILFSIAGIALITGIILALILIPGKTPDKHFDQLIGRADSIMSVQAKLIYLNGGIPTDDSEDRISQAIILLQTVEKEAPSDYIKEKEVYKRIGRYRELNEEIEEYMTVDRLVENARMTGMTDSVAKYTPIRLSMIERILKLTKQLE